MGDRNSFSINTPETLQVVAVALRNYDIEIADVIVRYTNGVRDTYQVRQLIPAGGEVGPIECAVKHAAFRKSISSTAPVRLVP